MITIDKLEQKTEKLVEQVRNLNFPFTDTDLEKEAEDAREEIIAALENFLELATQDWEQRPDRVSEDVEYEDSY
jgi:hypothetical protein